MLQIPTSIAFVKHNCATVTRLNNGGLKSRIYPINKRIEKIRVSSSNFLFEKKKNGLDWFAFILGICLQWVCAMQRCNNVEYSTKEMCASKEIHLINCV